MWLSWYWETAPAGLFPVSKKLSLYPVIKGIILLSMISIVISLVLLMYLAYRGYSVLILAPLMAALAVLLSGDVAQLLPLYCQTFMHGLSK